MKLDPKDPRVALALGMAQRLIPKEEFGKMVAAMVEIAKAANSIDERMRKIEGIADRLEGLSERVTSLESIVRNGVDGANGFYAEQAQWTPERIALALAPAKDGALQRDN